MIKHILLFVSACFAFAFTQGQSLISSRNTSFYTYFYKINDREAKEIHEVGMSHMDERFFHTLVDSVPTDDPYQPALPPGHYLRAFTIDNQLQFQLATIASCEIRVLNNSKDLKIQVFDPEGNQIQPESIELKRRPVKWDEETQAYRLKNGGREGLLEVKYGGMTHFFDLQESRVKRQFGRRVLRVLYVPAMIIWRPVRWAIFLPIDIVRSVVKLRPVGSVYRFIVPFRDLFRSIRYRETYGWLRIFRRNHYRHRRRNQRTKKERYPGYISFSKPKYRPNDTLKVKLYAQNKRGKPLDKELTMLLATPKGQKSFDVQPNHPGNYTFELPLGPDLELQLDRSYTVTFVDGKRKVRMGTFHYEDYELKDVTYELRKDKERHYPGDPLSIFASAKDPNGLPLADVHLKLFLQTKRIINVYEDPIFIPDTLWKWQQKLDPAGETKVTIPDSIFPPANLSYTLHAQLYNAERTVSSRSFEITFYHQRREISFQPTEKGVRVVLLVNGKKRPGSGKLDGFDGFNKKVLSKFIDFPHEETFDPWLKSYQVGGEGANSSYEIPASASGIAAFPRRTRDSLFIVLSNPRKLPVSYHIYRLNRELLAGQQDTLVVDLKAKGKKNHYLALQYLWKGRIREEQFEIPLLEKMLAVAVEQPDVVVPGQEAELKVRVTDVDGKGVENVDLLAYGLNSQFKNYAAPRLPNFQARRKARKFKTEYQVREKNLSRSQLLDFEEWNRRAGLDSIPKYQFLYPGDNLYTHLVPTPNKETEIAPFVVANGSILPVQIIYVDGTPIYFGWNHLLDPYSFPIKAGYHRIGIRLPSHSLSIDSVYIRPGYKNIISVDLNGKYPKLDHTDVPNELRPYEWTKLKPYVAGFYPNSEYNLPYIKNGDRIFKLSTNRTSYQNHGWAFGPVKGELEFIAPQQRTLSFFHESNFSYEFFPEILKMRSFDWKESNRIHLKGPVRSGFADRPWTEKQLQLRYRRYLEDQRLTEVSFTHWSKESPRTGILQIDLDNPNGPDFQPLCYVLQSTEREDLGRIYRSNTSVFSYLTEGHYKLTAFLRDDKSYVWDSLYVRRDGRFVYQLALPDSALTSAFPEATEEDFFDLAKKIFQYNADYSGKRAPRMPSDFRRIRFDGPTDLIQGRILDQDGMPVIGAVVMVDSTQFGTYTDMDGRFSLEAPIGRIRLLARMVGMKTLVKYVDSPGFVELEMEEDMIFLDEVQVTSLNVRSLDSPKLLSRSAGVVRSAPSRRLKAPRIEDSAPTIANSSSGTLYVVDGVVWNGTEAELPKDILSRRQLSADEATALFGNRGANGAVLLTTAKGLRDQQPEDALGEDYMDALSKANFLRSNFRDDAFWQPSLLTDANGEARFQVKFPDDITSWRTFALGIKKGGFTGQTEGSIRAFKPIMGQLRIPRFLLEGDTSFVIGKGTNYTPDSISTQLTYSQDGREIARLNRSFRYGVDDSAAVTAGKQDSTAIRFVLETSKGYKDGEERKIPVYPVGVVETNGHFAALGLDTTLSWDFDPQGGPVTVYAETDLLNTLRREIYHLHRYGYLCNEQAASKLKAYLAEKRICEMTGEEFKYERDVKKLVKRLGKKQLAGGAWSWWDDGAEIPWISLHVTEALVQAEEMGYGTTLNKSLLSGYARRIMEDTTRYRYFDRKLRAVEILMRLQIPANYKAYIDDLEPYGQGSLNRQFRIIRLKQQAGLPYSLDSLEASRQTDLFGNSFWGYSRHHYSLHSSSIMTTLLAYKILKEADKHADWIPGIIGYLLDARGKYGYWRNTYESALMIEALFSELRLEDGEIEKPQLQLSGLLPDTTIKEFPFTQEVSPGQALKVVKPGKYPVYLTAYQQRWEPNPKADGNNFEVRSFLDNKTSSISRLEKGKEVKLIVEVKVEKDAEFVMVEVPIPAGCTYARKPQSYYRSGEVHREYYRHKVAIFATRLNRGTYTYHIPLMPKFSGKYSLNPAKAEMMYFPVFYGRETVKRISIQ